MQPLLEPFERDLSRAHTLPARWYVDPQVFELEQRQIFRRTWQPVGRIAQVSRPGEFFTCEMAREPVVVVRDLDGKVRAFLNVCRHRAGAVAEGCGQRKTLQCHCREGDSGEARSARPSTKGPTVSVRIRAAESIHQRASRNGNP
jgi:nitrite reductase/ring-hydroxylating ferredoxin subunit